MWIILCYVRQVIHISTVYFGFYMQHFCFLKLQKMGFVETLFDFFANKKKQLLLFFVLELKVKFSAFSCNQRPEDCNNNNGRSCNQNWHAKSFQKATFAYDKLIFNSTLNNIFALQIHV